MTNKFEVLNQLPGLHGTKDTNGRYLHFSDQFCVYAGYESWKHFFAHERTDYDIRTKAVELASTFISDDQEVINNGEARKILQFSEFANGIRHMLFEKHPLIEDGKIVGVFFTAVDFTKTEVDKFFFNFLIGVNNATPNNKQLYYTIKSSFDNKLLTKRESECLFYIIRGESARMVANILKLSARTVEAHIDNIKYKLKCNNKAQLIGRALELGYYHVIPESLVSIASS